MKRFRVLLWAMLLSSVSVVACGEESLERQAAPLAMTSVPSWLRYFPNDWACDQTMKGRFVGIDSAHMYRFPGKLGYRYTFHFKATYHPSNGAAIAIYTLDNGARVAYTRASYKNEVSVTYQATRNVAYLVAVYSLWPRTTGTYSLHAACVRTQYCLEYETADEQGQSYRNLYAINVSSEAEAKQHLANVGPIVTSTVREGSCASQSTACPYYYAPICADTPAPQGTHSNVCALRAHIRQQAGETGQWKGHWEKGVCNPEGQFCGGIAGLPCPEGYQCVLDGTYPDAGGKCKKTAVCDPTKPGYDPSQCPVACKHDCDCVRIGRVCHEGFCAPLRRANFCTSCTDVNCKKGEPCLQPNDAIGICTCTVSGCPQGQLCCTGGARPAPGIDPYACMPIDPATNSCPLLP
ncbi:hypothetical protein L6R29_18030 [Myxococcota bacterium]|nr:hypothetical protein [Myxococcota bacterium]